MKNVTHTAPHRWIWKFDFWQCERCDVVTFTKNSVSFTACAPRRTIAPPSLSPTAEPTATDDDG